MWIKPPTVLILWFAFFNVLWIYKIYKIWFRTNTEYKNELEKANKLPAWHPFKDYSIEILKDKNTWAAQTKAISVMGTGILILMDILLVIAMIFGK